MTDIRTAKVSDASRSGIEHDVEQASVLHLGQVDPGPVVHDHARALAGDAGRMARGALALGPVPLIGMRWLHTLTRTG